MLEFIIATTSTDCLRYTQTGAYLVTCEDRHGKDWPSWRNLEDEKFWNFVILSV